jgi:hypothetical protein
MLILFFYHEEHEAHEEKLHELHVRHGKIIISGINKQRDFFKRKITLSV